MRTYSLAFVFVGMMLSFAPVRAEQTAIFSDDFQQPQLSSQWEIHDGDWHVENGALTVSGGGTISLKQSPGGCFSLEFEIVFPSHWMSVIPLFTAPDDYATLYLGSGYWESFQMVGDDIADYVQRRDAEIAPTGNFQKIKVISQYGSVRFTYDGKEKGPVSFPFRPGARIAFRSLPGSGQLKIRNVRLSAIDPPPRTIVSSVSHDQLSGGVMGKDRGIEGKPGMTAEPLSVDAGGVATVSYAFADDEQFESCFARIPTDVKSCGWMFVEVEADDSHNHFFVIVHDSSGEQHLVIKSALAWTGWQEVGIDLAPCITGPRDLERLVIHWGGDGNQKIDFPIRAIDIGIAKRRSLAARTGQIHFRSLTFAE